VGVSPNDNNQNTLTFLMVPPNRPHLNAGVLLRIAKRLRPHLATLACCRLGSRVVEHLYKASSIECKVP
jgi:hypothetical protein